MMIAMNRFKVRPGHETEFEEIWEGRESRLKGVPGFIEFKVLRGASFDDHTLYSTHTLWTSLGDFEAWTQSDAFREAHRSAGSRSHIYLTGPHLECFEVLQSMAADT
ncbi:antibiotic biosynthesis monooxygenase family protein [Ectothiorhodospira marina]|uniref:Heme-degrading monooxygenase HmoA n=1 Tax=Ectothiorhodospira marina TaxID=1396821 RepID=A0A1H7QF24_9GAMM|nr:antibiotic biosynthesis monooxygenase [Ectothiorhodospira marina]SEL46419.1 Heme-degrading monooxygenase HmoA [Ectothiorhodospira marina]